MRLDSWEFPDDLLYDEHHQWVRLAGDAATVGLTDFGQFSRGDVLYVQLPALGSAVERDEAVASIETGKWVGRIYAPFAGVVAAVNGGLTDDPGLINRSPYGKGWILAIRRAAESGTGGLMAGEPFAQWLREEIEKYQLDGTDRDLGGSG